MRLGLLVDHDYYDGIATTMSIDSCTYLLFRISKPAADLMVQDYSRYSRYFEMPTVCFHGGCLAAAVYNLGGGGKCKSSMPRYTSEPNIRAESGRISAN